VAFPSVRTSNTTNGTSAATNPVVNLPGTLTAGDTLLMHFRKASGAQNAPAGWTELINSTADASNDTTLVAWKKVTGSEGATATMTGGDVSAFFVAIVLQFQDASDPAVTPPTAAAVATGSSTVADPPNHTVGAAQDIYWLALGAWEGEQTSPPVGFPTDFDLNRLAASSGTGGSVATNCRVACAGRQLNTTAQNPAGFSMSVSDDWTATTVAIFPSAGKTVAADAGSYAITGTAAGTQRNREVIAGDGAYALTGQAATLSKGITMDAGAGAYALTGQAVTFPRTRIVEAAAGSYALTGQDASLEFGREIVAAAGGYALSGQAASLAYGREVVAAAGSYAVTGADADLIYTPIGAVTLDAESGAYLLTGTAAGLLLGRLIVADDGAYALTGSGATLTWSGDTPPASDRPNLSMAGLGPMPKQRNHPWPSFSKPAA
jgi:hypothetical protein